MDSERRHELETNDLREFLDNFKDFWDKHGNKILLVLIVVLGGYAGYNYYNQYQTGVAEEAYTQLAAATTVDQLLAVADEHDMVHDEAMRRAADLALGAARVALVEGEADTAEESLKQASSAYTALVSRGATDEYKLVGHEGLAKAAVMASKWDQARAHYEKMIDLAGERFPVQAARAEADMQNIGLYKKPIAFAPEEDLSFIPDPIDDDTSEDGTGDTDKPKPAVPGIDLPSFDPTNPNP